MAPSTPWPELLRLALLGTERAALPPELYSREEEDSPEDALLREAYTHYLLARGARPWETYERPLKASAPAEPAVPCSPRAAQLLLHMLEGHHEPALPEFVRLLAAHGKVLPHAALPSLLDLCLEQPDYWPLVAPALGERGAWLARRHPHWSGLLPPETPIDWTTSPPHEQVDAFRRQRQTEPDRARDRLRDRWEELEVKPRAQLVAAMKVALSPSDEPLLEQALNDSRKEVRLPAADLLADLPESNLLSRLFEQARDCFEQKGKQFRLNLPEEPPRATRRDGILPTGSKAVGGLRLNWLVQMLARIPADRWLEHWSLDAGQLIQAWARTEHGPSLLRALVSSLVRHPREHLATALVRHCLETGNEFIWNHPEGHRLLHGMPPSSFNQLLIGWLERYGPLVPENTLAHFWLAAGKHPWHKRLTQLVTQGLREALGSGLAAHWSTWHYRRLLEVAAYQSEPSLLEVLRSGWNFRGTAARWEPEVEKMLQTLHFRREMRRAIREG